MDVGFQRDPTGVACLGGLSLSELIATGTLKTPAYVYDLEGVAQTARSLRAGFEGQRHLVCYAVKANSAGPILRVLRDEGCGADVVSGAELALALACDILPSRIVYSGVAKRDDEIDAALATGDEGILALQIESVEEIPRVAACAGRLGRRARVSLRVNPGVEVETHAHIATGHDEAKFGIARADLELAFEQLRFAENVVLVGLSTHVGSQLTTISEYRDAARILLRTSTVAEVALGRGLEFIDFGGGFGIDYGSGCAVTPADFAACASKLVREANRADMTILCEPGRSLVGPFGVLVSSVIMEKRGHVGEDIQTWLMIDAGMNDLIRPALYAARHRIEPVECAPSTTGRMVRIVGPVCESSDDFGEHDAPGMAIRHVVIRDAGAYGFTMASEYNGRPLPQELFVRHGTVVAEIASHSATRWVAERVGARVSSEKP